MQLQLELGKAVAPYKEVIVEEAIAQFLANADQKFVDEILKRQKTRWGQRTKGNNVYAKCKNLADINIKCTMILAKFLAMKSS